MASLTRDGILAAASRRPVEVEVPEWGGSVHVWPLTALQLLELNHLRRTATPADVMRWILGRCIGDVKGPSLSDEDVGAIGGEHTRVLTRLAETAMKLNGFTPEALEEARGNS